MLVQCPECMTKYNLDESKIGAAGSKVRCTRCAHVFTAFRPMAVAAQPEPTPQPATRPASSLDDELSSLFDDAPGRATASAVPQAAAPRPVPAASKAPVDEDMLADLKGAFQQPLLDRPSASSPLHVDDEPKPKPKKKAGKFLLVLMLLLLLAGLAAGGIYIFKPALLHLPVSQPATAPAPPGQPGPKEGAAQIALENVRQYFVPNEKEGQLFIIEGKAVNRFPAAREMIKLKATLFDKQGGEVVKQEFMCGNVVSLYQLQVSTRADIEAALSAKVGILTNNTNIQPGASVPFMVVFFKAPETVEEFGLEVLQSLPIHP